MSTEASTSVGGGSPARENEASWQAPVASGKWWRLTLRARMVVLIVLSLVPAAAVGIQYIHQGYQEEVAAAHYRADALAGLLSDQIRQRIAEADHLIWAIGQSPLVNYGDYWVCSGVLSRAMQQYGGFAEMIRIERDGAITCSSTPHVRHLELDHQIWFDAVWESDALTVVPFQSGTPLPGRVMIALRQMAGTRPEGSFLLGFTLSLDWLSEEIGRASLPPETSIYLVDQDWRIILHYPTAEDRIGRGLTGTAFAGAFAASNLGSQTIVDQDGHERIFSARTLSVGQTDLTLLVGLEKDVALAGIMHRRDQTLVLFLLVLGAVGVTTTVGLTRLVHVPIRALQSAAACVGKGVAGVRVAVGGPREIASLASGFNAMADAIESRDRELRDREALLNEAQRIGRFGSWRWNPESDEIAASSMAHEIIGFDPSATPLTMGFVTSLMLLEDRLRFETELERAVGRLDKFAEEVRLNRSSDAAEIIVRIVGEARRYGGDRQPSVTGSIQEVTHLRRCEAEASKLAVVADRTDNAVIITDVDGRIEWVNDGFRRITGYDADEVIGYKPGDLLQGPETEAETVATIRHHLRRGEPCSAELVNYAKDGRRYWVSLDIQPIHDEFGRLSRFIAVERDVTDSKLLERRLLRAEEIAHIGHWRLDLDTMMISWSNECYRIYGVDRLFVPSFAAVLKRYHPDDRAHVQSAFKSDAVAEQVIDFEARIVWPDGEIRHVAIRAELEFDDTSRPCAAFGIVQDITEQKRNEAFLIKAKREAEEADRAKSAFLATMSHELRTPLNAIIGFADILRSAIDALPPESRQEYIGYIETAGQQLLTLVNSILELSTLRSQPANPTDEEVDVPALINEVLGEYQADIEARQITVRVDVERDRAVWLRAERRAVGQMLRNLMSNSIKFTPGGEIVISYHRIGGDPAIVVRDTGQGIPPDRLAKVTEAFMSTDNPYASSGSGAGIGLPIVKGMIEAHGGRMTMDSEVGLGTTVALVFPADRAIDRPANGRAAAE